MSNTKLTPKARLMVIMERMRETYNEEAWGINQRMMIPTSGIKSRILSMGDGYKFENKIVIKGNDEIIE
jgi:hypothetical protein